MTREQIRSEALALSPDERVALAEDLLQSLSGPDRDAIDAAWLAEARRRHEAYVAGRSSALPVDDVVQGVMQRAAP